MYPATVQWMSWGDGSTAVLRLRPGSSASFGTCLCGSCRYDILVRSSVHFAVAVTAYGDHWRASNLSSASPVIIADLEYPDQFVRVPPGRADIPVPFELAQIGSVMGEASDALTVFGPEPRTVHAAEHPCPASAEADIRPLNPQSTYFAVLQELCAPRQGGGSTLPLPTSSQIAGSLQEYGIHLTPRAVDHHIDYLVQRLGVSPPPGLPAGRSWKKEALVGEALRRGLLEG